LTSFLKRHLAKAASGTVDDAAKDIVALKMDRASARKLDFNHRRPR